MFFTPENGEPFYYLAQVNPLRTGPTLLGNNHSELVWGMLSSKRKKSGGNDAIAARQGFVRSTPRQRDDVPCTAASFRTNAERGTVRRRTALWHGSGLYLLRSLLAAVTRTRRCDQDQPGQGITLPTLDLDQTRIAAEIAPPRRKTKIIECTP